VGDSCSFRGGSVQVLRVVNLSQTIAPYRLRFAGCHTCCSASVTLGVTPLSRLRCWRLTRSIRSAGCGFAHGHIRGGRALRNKGAPATRDGDRDRIGTECQRRLCPVCVTLRRRFPSPVGSVKIEHAKPSSRDLEGPRHQAALPGRSVISERHRPGSQFRRRARLLDAAALSRREGWRPLG
jgi:hypothetical protein